MTISPLEQIDTKTKLWRWQSAASPSIWYFLTISGEAANAIRAAATLGQWTEGRRGFGSAKVNVTIGETSWDTSVFPYKECDGWLLPVKASVRKAEGLNDGDEVAVRIAL